MPRSRTRSALANAFLGVLGVLFVAAAVVVSVWLLIQTWGYASRLELALQIVLAACAVFGAYLIALCRGVRLPTLHRRHRRGI